MLSVMYMLKYRKEVQIDGGRISSSYLGSKEAIENGQGEQIPNSDPYRSLTIKRDYKIYLLEDYRSQ